MVLTIKDVREAIAYGHDCGVENLSDEQLLKADFLKDLGMGNIRVAKVSIELCHRHGIDLPPEIFREMEDNTVASFIKVANAHLKAAEQK